MTEQISISAQAAVDSLISSLYDWLTQLIWYSGCQVTSVADVDSGWVVARIQDGTNQRCRWKKLFPIAVGDYVDVLYDPRTMQFEIFKPGGATIWSDPTCNIDQDSVRTEYTNSSTGTLNFGEVVVFDSGADLTVDTTTTLGDLTVAGVVVIGAAVGSLVQLAQFGIAHVLVDGNVTRGQFLKTSTTRGQATPTTGLERGTFAISLTGNAAGAGVTVEAFIVGHSWFTQSSQKVTVGPYGCDFTLPSLAITYINGLATGPVSGREFDIEIEAGTFTEAANVTIPQYVHAHGQGEETVLDLGNFELGLAADTSLEGLIVTSTGSDGNVLMQVNGDNAVLRDVRLILTGTGNDCLRLNAYAGLELYHVIIESTDDNGTAIYCDGCTALLWDVMAHDTAVSHWGTAGLYLDNGADVTTKFCEFGVCPGGDDVLTIAGTTWNHFSCQFDPSASTLAAGSHTALGSKRFNQTLVVAEAGGEFTSLGAAITYINAQADAAAGKLYGVLMLAGNFAETGNVTVPQYVSIVGMGEGTEIEMGANILSMSADSSLEYLVVESSNDTTAVQVNAVSNVLLRDVKISQTGGNGDCLLVSGGADVECRNVIFELTAGAAFGIVAQDNGTTLLLEYCTADNTTNFFTALVLSNHTVTVTAKYCTIRGNTNDIEVGAAATFNHFMCQFDPDNSLFAGTENPMVTGKANFDDIVYVGNGITMDGPTTQNIFTVPDHVAQAFNLVDAGGLEYMRIVSTNAGPRVFLFPGGGGRVTIGHTTAAGDLTVVNGGGAVITSIYVDSYTDDAAFAGMWVFRKSHTDTIGNQVQTINGEWLGSVTWVGVNSAPAFNDCAYLQVIQDGVAGVAFIPTKMLFCVGTNAAGPTAQLTMFNDGALTLAGPSMTVPDDWWIGIGGALERIVFDAAGDISFLGCNVGIGTATPGHPLEVQGGVQIGNAATHGYLDMPNLIGNPSMRILLNQIAVQNVSIVNAWGAATNPGIMVGTTRADGVAFQVHSSVPVVAGFASGAGTVRFVVLGDGNAGLGTLTPNYLADPNGAVLSILGQAQNTPGVLELVSPDVTAANVIGKIEFLNLDGGAGIVSRAIIAAVRDGADDAALLDWYTMAAGGVLAKNMTLLGVGFLGVKCQPSTRLDIDAGAFEMAEMAAPGAGAANTCRLYCVDNAGKTELYAIFNTGAAQLIAAQP